MFTAKTKHNCLAPWFKQLQREDLQYAVRTEQ